MPIRPWSPEQRAAQAEAIKRWKPWKSSTGPRSPEGKALAARNAYKGGQRQKMRDDVRQINALLRAQRDLLNEVAP